MYIESRSHIHNEWQKSADGYQPRNIAILNTSVIRYILFIVLIYYSNFWTNVPCLWKDVNKLFTYFYHKFASKLAWKFSKLLASFFFTAFVFKIVHLPYFHALEIKRHCKIKHFEYSIWKDWIIYFRFKWDLDSRRQWKEKSIIRCVYVCVFVCARSYIIRSKVQCTSYQVETTLIFVIKKTCKGGLLGRVKKYPKDRNYVQWINGGRSLNDKKAN